MEDLKGKVALVSGGARGLGFEIALTLAEAGCTVCVCSRRIEVEGRAVQVLKETGQEVYAEPCDVTQKDQIEHFVQNILNKYKRIDILVNNSGATWGASVEDMPEEAWDKVMNVNVKGPFLLSQRVGKVMKEQGYGKIINVASVAGLKAEPPEVLDAIGYSTSKAAVIHFTKDLARKWASHNIYVNAIAPGFFKSDMTKGILEEKEEQIKKGIPLRRIGEPPLLRGPILFLASSASDFVTGHTLPVDGGAHL
ncbi:SDR family oxidoreductase [Thalassobacillus sp. C254]|uniref:SDR family oxidoreductase n=1 Tax=Thalassobacillus sp. C254 TaxID=1225341 RepID=UPI0006CFFBB0|nr:SDR family oxidoreductase [Thalassobacillus sp. C254]